MSGCVLTDADVQQGLDPDGDGVAWPEDCANDDPATSPGAAWLDSETACMTDADGDGYGAAAPHAGAQPGTDCDDSDASVHPAAVEVCDGRDADCDQRVDEGTEEGTWYRDDDGDGFGGEADPTLACGDAEREPVTATPGDCDDADTQVHPDAAEVCNLIDDNCDGVVDEDAAIDARTWHRDDDGDTYGRTDILTRACERPDGWTARDGDCDDADFTVFPGGPEYCDSLDNDCDEVVDEELVDGSTFYIDTDGDGFGEASRTFVGCWPDPGFVANALDCDDADAGEPVVVDALNGTLSGSGSGVDPMRLLQDGLDAADACVLVYPGTYTESLSIAGDLLLTSRDGADATVLDAGMSPCSAEELLSGGCAGYGSVLTVAAGATPTVQGFTLRGGTGHAAPYPIESGGQTVTVYDFCGGAVYVEGGALHLVDVVLTDNVVPGATRATDPDDAARAVWTFSFGGGLCARASTIELLGVAVRSNVAELGGGLYAEGSQVSLHQTQVGGNQAVNGGGVFIEDSDLDATNALLVFNEATGNGGGILHRGSGVSTLVNVTVVGNTAGTSRADRAEALLGEDQAQLEVRNSILVSLGEGPLAVSSAAGSTAYSAWYSATGGETVGTGWRAGPGDIAQDPRFIGLSDDGDLTNDDYGLRATSPALDAGDPSAVYNDADGTPNDMGVYGGPAGNF
ncbi:MAG: putative metal-binding motif-containing protein [Alphaproteobacteria bacterium]|nr:putative metal-binding motif-containing protein [Alphaproteobacteria bacterium]